MAYGLLFGVSPALLAETFGINGLSQNWGLMTLGPAIFGEIFNLLYGSIYDSHSKKRPDGVLECSEGKSCYSTAYTITLVSAVVCIGITLWCIRHRNIKERKLRKQEEDVDDDHVA